MGAIDEAIALGAQLGKGKQGRKAEEPKAEEPKAEEPKAEEPKAAKPARSSSRMERGRAKHPDHVLCSVVKTLPLRGMARMAGDFVLLTPAEFADPKIRSKVVTVPS